MKRHQATFFLAGLIAGLICVSFRSFGSAELVIVGLTWAVGPLFFVAVVVGLAITRTLHHVRGGPLRYLGGLILSTFTYMLALFAFFVVVGFPPKWFGFRPSANIVHFGIDVWLGLIAAGAVAATGIALLSALLTGKWSKALLGRLLLAALVTILVTFIVNLPFQTDWSFLGVLLPLGNALFCCVVGTQIWQQTEATGQVANSTRLSDD